MGIKIPPLARSSISHSFCWLSSVMVKETVRATGVTVAWFDDMLSSVIPVSLLSCSPFTSSDIFSASACISAGFRNTEISCVLSCS